VAELVNVRLLPAHSVVAETFALLIDGVVFTVTEDVVAVVEPHELVAVTV
jgi:hypothetical protein